MLKSVRSCKSGLLLFLAAMSRHFRSGFRKSHE
jgi:hypothetical protein